MKPIIRWTIRQRRWSIIWWVVGVVAFIVLELAFYPSIRDQQAQLEQSFSKLSDSTVALFSDTGDLFSPDGYLSGQIFYLMMPMLLGILAIGLGASLIGREEREGTLELLLARPVSRSKLLLSKTTAGVLIVLAVGIIGSIATALMCKIVELPIPFINIFLAGMTTTLLATSFGAVAFMVTMLGRGAKSASIGIAALLAITGYLLSSLSQTVHWLRYPSKIFPFDYYHPAEILRGNYNWLNILFILGVIVLCGFVSWIAFRRRDLTN